MAYVIGNSAIYYNAFYSVQDLTRTLSEDDIATFKGYLLQNIETVWKSDPDPYEHYRTFYENDDWDFFRRYRDDYHKFGNAYLFTGKAMDEEKIRRINLCLPSRQVKEAMKRTHKEFRDYIKTQLQNNSHNNDFESIL